MTFAQLLQIKHEGLLILIWYKKDHLTPVVPHKWEGWCSLSSFVLISLFHSYCFIDSLHFLSSPAPLSVSGSQLACSALLPSWCFCPFCTVSIFSWLYSQSLCVIPALISVQLHEVCYFLFKVQLHYDALCVWSLKEDSLASCCQQLLSCCWQISQWFIWALSMGKAVPGNRASRQCVFGVTVAVICTYPWIMHCIGAMLGFAIKECMNSPTKMMLNHSFISKLASLGAHAFLVY